MDKLKISKSSKQILYTMYKEYLQRIKNGDSKQSAKIFGSSKEIRRQLFPDLRAIDVLEDLGELARNKLVSGPPADDDFYFCALTDLAIYELENRFKNGLREVVDFLLKLKP